MSSIFILGLSKNREHYVQLNELQFKDCKRLEDKYYCNNIQYNYVPVNDFCELRLLLGQPIILSKCKINFVKISNSIFTRVEK